MSHYESKNPFTGKSYGTFTKLTRSQVLEKLSMGHQAWETWRYTSFQQRAIPMRRCAEILRAKPHELGRIITQEMGKPFTQAKAEIEKCAWVCDYYAKEAEKQLAPAPLESDGKAYLRYDPLGIVLAVMPWNFPFWQVFRFLAPSLMAGNGGLLKHASNVPRCALAIEQVVLEAGFPEGLFQNLFIDRSDLPALMEDPRLKAVTLTGSEAAGASIASLAGKNIKKSVLELGGSDPFIVLPDVDLDEVIPIAVKSRFQNTGQSCIAAKRFIIHEAIYDDFTARFKTAVEILVCGDPSQETTDIATLARPDLTDEFEWQVQKSVEAGARVLTGGHRHQKYPDIYLPTLLTDIPKASPAYADELFGPAASLFKVKDDKEAVALANDTVFGLGASIWTKDLERAGELAAQIESGSVFINAMVSSDPRLPFGGIKTSGYGRELSAEGIREFTNQKTVFIS